MSKHCRPARAMECATFAVTGFCRPILSRVHIGSCVGRLPACGGGDNAADPRDAAAGRCAHFPDRPGGDRGGRGAAAAAYARPRLQDRRAPHRAHLCQPALRPAGLHAVCPILAPTPHHFPVNVVEYCTALRATQLYSWKGAPSFSILCVGSSNSSLFVCFGVAVMCSGQ